MLQVQTDKQLPYFAYGKFYSIITENSDEWIATSDVTVYMNGSKSKSEIGAQLE